MHFLKHIVETVRPYCVWLFVSVVVLLSVHVLFSIPSPFPWLRAKWCAGDVLGYCGSILGAIAAISSVVLTLRHENESRRQDLRMAVKPLIALSLPEEPFEMHEWFEWSMPERRSAIEQYMNVDRCLVLEREKDSSDLMHIRYPRRFSKEQLTRIEGYLGGRDHSHTDNNGMTYYTAPDKKCFWHIELVNIGAGPAVNVSIWLDRQGVEVERFGGSPIHSPTAQIPVGESISLGVYFEDGYPVAEQSDLVIRYYDRDMREYQQRSAFMQHIAGAMVKELDFNICQKHLGKRG